MNLVLPKSKYVTHFLSRPLRLILLWELMEENKYQLQIRLILSKTDMTNVAASKFS